jgi:type I restriction enzyme M protein
MNLDNFVNNLRKEMRKDAGIDGDAQRIGQLVWLLFLKIYDSLEEDWEVENENYVSIIPENLKWRNWAIDNKDGKALTGDDLLKFVNNELFETLKNIEITEDTPQNQIIVKEIFQEANNYMKDGIILRKVINKINELNFDEYEDRHVLGDIYEIILKELQSAGDSGEFYTPRPITDFMAQVLNPQLGNKVGDFACGTGGFLISAISVLKKQAKTVEDEEILHNSVFGIEKKSLPYLLCVTNMLLHEIENPNIIHGNSFDQNVKDYSENDKFDIVLMNPPFGGSEDDIVLNSFPVALRTKETADLFMNVIMYRLKQNGKAGVVLPNGFLSGTDEAKTNIKKKLIEEFNLHTIVRFPKGVFLPYNDIPVNLLFFDKTESTKNIWYYNINPPKGRKNFTKKNPLTSEHLRELMLWWDNRQTNDNAFNINIDEIIDNDYNLDIHEKINTDFLIYDSPNELLEDYIKQKDFLSNKMDKIIGDIKKILEMENL